MTLSDLRLRLRALFAAGRVERELDEELAFHLECETRKQLASGLDPEDARRRALARFGPVPLAADQCRDQRGVSFVDALVRDVRYALRSLSRAPLVALTVISTLALGLGLVTVVFTFVNMFLFRIDAVRNPDELFAAERPTRPGARAWIPFTQPEYEALRRDTDVFVDVAARHDIIRTRIDGRAATGMLVSGNFFDMLGVKPARGRMLMQADNDSGGRAAIVLSHRGWEKLFANDPTVLGRRIQLNGHPYEVVGIMPEGFRGLRPAPPDYWAPLARIAEFRPETKANRAWIDVIGRLKPGASPEVAAAALTAWASTQPDSRKPGSAPIHVTLRPSRGVLSTDRGEALVAVTPIFFAFALILLIGCANVANLLLARGLSRHREIGVRLSLGATRRRIVRQLLTESLLLALAAAPIAFMLSRALFTGTVHLTVSVLPAEFAESTELLVPPADWRVLLFLFVGALGSTILFGLVPALHSTRLELVRAMRGEVTRDARPGRVRHVLIGAQVTASALLLVCAAVFLRSTFAAASTDAGVRTADTVVVSTITENTRPAMLQAIREHSAVRAVAAAWPAPTGEGAYAEATVASTKLPVGYKLVSPEYFGLLGVNLLRGRLFRADERGASAGVVVLSESVAHRLWPGGDPLGQAVRLDAPMGYATRVEGAPQPPAQVFTVIGIVRDIRSPIRLFDLGYSGVYIPTSPEQSKASLLLQVHGDPEATRLALLNALTRVDPALGGITTMKMMAQLETSLLKLVFWVAVILASLALALTVSGLFSVLSYLVEQRKSEIGVRMALGATPGDVVRLVLAQSLRPIAIGVVVGGGLALALATVLLATPASAMIGSLVRAFDPIAYAASLAVIVATCLIAALVPASRAARIDPIATLRAD